MWPPSLWVECGSGSLNRGSVGGLTGFCRTEQLFIPATQKEEHAQQLVARARTCGVSVRCARMITGTKPKGGKAREDLLWNHCTSAPHRSGPNGIPERATRRIKEGISSILLQSGLDEPWWAESVECYCSSRNVQNLLSNEKLNMNGVLANNAVVQSYHSEQKSNIIRFRRKTRRDSINSARKYSQASLWVMLHMRVKGDLLVADVEELISGERRIRSLVQRDQNKRSCGAERRGQIHTPIC